MRLNKIILLSALGAVSVCAGAEENIPDHLKSKFQSALQDFQSGGQLSDVYYDPRAGLYLLVSESGGTAYINKAADTMFLGSVLKIEDGKVINKTKEKLIQRARLAPKEWSVEYKAKGKEIGVVTVFFDVSCTYCRSMHRAIKELNDYGVSVRYLAYPRAGLNSEDAQVMRSIWCRPNAVERLDNYLNGYAAVESILVEGQDKNDCGLDVVEQGYNLGRSVDIKGTPALLFENNTLKNYAMKASSIYKEVLKGEEK